MTPTKTSKLLLAWLWSQGHKIDNYEKGKGITTTFGEKQYRFSLSNSYDGYNVVYNDNTFSFYDGDKLLKQTDLNEFR